MSTPTILITYAHAVQSAMIGWYYLHQTLAAICSVSIASTVSPKFNCVTIAAATDGDSRTRTPPCQMTRYHPLPLLLGATTPGDNGAAKDNNEDGAVAAADGDDGSGAYDTIHTEWM